jgi:hypothetical protein
VLNISQDQFEEIGARTREKPIDMLVRYVRERFPRATSQVAPDEIIRFVEQATSRSQLNNVHELSHLATWLDLSLMFGLDFISAPWASDVWQLEGVSVAEKIAALSDRVRKVSPSF